MSPTNDHLIVDAFKQSRNELFKRLYNKPGQTVISNYSTHKKKASEFLDNHLKPIMKSN